MESITKMITDFFICTRKNNPEEFNKACDVNGIFGIYRVEFENYLDKVEKKC